MYTCSFEQLALKDVATAGGKGASLADMLAAGLPVPSGFVVATSAFDDLVMGAKVADAIDSILRSIKFDSSDSLNLASHAIRNLILEQSLPVEFQEEIMRRMSNMASKFVAVRSSATTEDSIDASWAGELDSYLNVTEKDVIPRMQQCWASLFNPRAIVYRNERGLLYSRVSLAVAIQPMIQSEVSGVTFTVHPVSEDRNHMVIEAVWGLGELLVGGLVTPDCYSFDKSTNKVTEIVTSFQDRMLRNSTGATGMVTVPTGRQNTQKLTEADIIKLAALCLRIEQFWGHPCDIEWGYSNASFYILQSRPITTLNGSDWT